MDKYEINKALKMAETIISDVDSSRVTAANINSGILSRRDKAHEKLKEYHKNLISKLQENQRYFERLLNDLCTKRNDECQQIIVGINERAMILRQLKGDLETLDVESANSAKSAGDLREIIDHLNVLKRENDKMTSNDALQKLLEMEFDYQPSGHYDFVAQLLDRRPGGALLYLNSCGVRPDEVELDVRDGQKRICRKTTVCVKFPPAVLGENRRPPVLYYVKVEAVNLLTKGVDNLPFQLVFPGVGIGYEFNPQQCCDYQIRCTLYDIPVKNSPVTVCLIPACADGATGGITEKLNSSLNLSGPRVSANNFEVAIAALPKEPTIGAGRGYPLGCTGRSRLESLLRAPGVAADGSRVNPPILNSLSDSEAPLETSEWKRHEDLSGSGSSAITVVEMPQPVAPAMNKFNPPPADISVAKNKVVNGNASVPRYEQQQRNNFESAENWDFADLPSVSSTTVQLLPPAPAFADHHQTHPPSSPGFKPHTRPDLTNLIRRGHGIGAKFVLEMGKFGKCEPVKAYFYKPIGCTCNEELGLYIICDTDHNAVKVYDRNGGTKLMVDGNSSELKLHRPSAACVVEENNFIIKDNKKLYKFSAEGQLLDVFNGGGQFKQLFGLAQDNRGVLLTMDLMNSRAGECPVLYGIDGTTGKILMCNEFSAVKNVEGSKCYFMDCYDDMLVVSDLGRHCVYVCDASGELKLTFGVETMRGEPGRFRQPSGVTIDGGKNIFVGDACNNRIQVWSHFGEYLGDVVFSGQMPNIYRPSDIHLTADGHLMVMNLNKHFISVYKLEALP